MKTRARLLDQYGNPIMRMDNKYLASGFSHSAASLTKPIFKGWEFKGGSPDDDIVANLPIMRQRCRQIGMEDPVFSGMYETLSSYTVGTGLIPQPVPDEDYLIEQGVSPDVIKKFKTNALRCWEAFAEKPHCDVYHRDNLYELMDLACRAADESGDVFVTMPRFERHNALFDLKIQVVEADCVADPGGLERLDVEMRDHDVYGGVEVSQWGEVKGYWFYTGHPLASRRRTFTHNEKKFPRWVFIPAYGQETGEPLVLHIMHSIRPGQRRGVPILAPSLEMALMLSQYMKAETISARIQALFTLVVTSENPDSVVGAMEEIEGDRLTDGDESMIALGNGIVQYARPGEKIEPVNPSRPTTAFGPFMETGLTIIGSSTLPYEMLMKKYGQSFSATKAANAIATTKFKIRRGRFVGDFCQPVYCALTDEAVMKGYNDAPGYFDDPLMRLAWQRCKWSGIGMPQVDLKDAAATAEKMISLALSTAGEQSSELTGSDYMENLEVRRREIEAARAAGLPEAAATAMTKTAEVAQNAEQGNANRGGIVNG